MAVPIESSARASPAGTPDVDLEDFFENGAMPLHIVDGKGTIVRVNRAELELLGYDPDDYVGQPIQRFHADPHVIEDILARLLRGETIRDYPARLVAKDGSIRHVLIDSSGRFRDGAFEHTRCFTRDVTRLRESEAELEASRRQLAATEKLAALGGLVMGVAHEIRTPLTIIQTNLHVLEARARVARESGDYSRLAEVLPRVASDVDAAIERAEALVKSLRRLTKAESHTTRQPVEPIVDEAIDLFAIVNRTPVRVERRSEPTPPLMADKARLQQVVLNLLDNAAAASAAGKSPIVVSTRREGDYVCVVVEDRGHGMTREVLARLYEPLFTTRADGTGLGLSIVKRIVHDHGGSIECRSAPGAGTRFTVRLPVG